MLDEKVRRSVSSGEGMDLFNKRMPQTKHAKLPAGTRLISSDNHYPVTEDIFHAAFPNHLKEKAPRIWWDEEGQIYQIGVNFQPLIPASVYPLIRSMEDYPGAKDMKARMQDLDAEGVDKELVYPQTISMFFGYPDLEVRKWLFKIYNQHMAEVQKQAPGRFFAAGLTNFWDPTEAAASVREIHELGLKTFMLPIAAGNDINGKPIIWSDRQYDEMWATAQELGIAGSFHVGEGFKGQGLNGMGAQILWNTGPSQFRQIYGHLVYGLVFDRFPNLQIAFVEAGINWVAGLLQDSEMISNHHALLFESRPKHRPSHYWHNNCYATFQDDIVGLRLLDIIGADRIMWAVDYPHNEGVFGYTHDAIQKIVDATTPDEARLILGGTAQKVYKF